MFPYWKFASGWLLAVFGFLLCLYRVLGKTTGCDYDVIWPDFLKYRLSIGNFWKLQKNCLYSLLVKPRTRGLQHAITSENIMFGTDGSGKHNNISFTWIASDLQGNWLIINNGCSTGQVQYSYRAESHAILSQKIFYHHFETFFSTSFPFVLEIHTNSDSFIKRFHKCTQDVRSITISTHYFIPEWDIFTKILHMDKSNRTFTVFHNVTSHQDKNKSFDKLPLKVQLNIEAGHLATKQTERSNSNKYCPLHSSTKVQLLIN